VFFFVLWKRNCKNLSDLRDRPSSAHAGQELGRSNMSSSQLMGSVSSLKTGVGLELSNSIQKILAALKINWLQNYNQALEKAALTSGSPSQGAQLVMAFFTGSDWCPYCQALSSEVFNKLDFHLWFNSRLMVPLLVDYPHTTAQPDDIKTQNAALLQQYNITGFPTVVAIKATAGYCLPNGHCVTTATEVGRLVGYVPGSGEASWIANFSAVAHIQ